MRYVYRPGFQLRSVLLASLSAAALALATPAFAAGERAINLPAGSLEASLAALASQTGEQLAFPHELVVGKRAPAVSGRLTVDQALARLLANTDIDATRAGPKLVVLKRQAEPVARANPIAAAPAATTRPFDAQTSQAAPPESLPTGDRLERTTSPVLVDEVRVTGSHIRGGSPAAPIIVLDRADLERSGHATIAAALQTLPQNFGGESTESTAGAIGADRLSSNTGYATSINLRGLGSDSTLVLVNGRRLAGSGNRGDFADVSSIPAIAVERVEVLLDGASALYGSDAVGGVVNVILRRDFKGAELRLRAGTGDNGPGEGLAAAVLGHSWTGGSLLVALEAYRRKSLLAEDRSWTASPDLRSRGGGDYRDTFSFPGNILRTDPVTGGTEPFWAIPAGQPGTALRPSDFVAGTVNRYNQNAGLAVIPDQRRQSAYAVLRQDLSSRVEVSAEARYSFRKARAESFIPIASLRVTTANPFFVSPNGSTTHTIQYAFDSPTLDPLNLSGVESLSVSGGFDADLFGDWRATGYAAFARETIRNRQTGIHSLILAEALGNSPDNPGTAYSSARDGFFNPFAGIGGTNPAALAAITSAYSSTRYRGEVRSGNVQADGSVFQLPGGAVKLAVGAQYREEGFQSRGENYSSTVAPVPIAGFDRDRRVAAVYGEARIPIFGPDNRRPGFERLELSAAVRGEDYSDFGRTVNPRFGVQWAPRDGVLVRATYGESFRAPALTELYGRQTYSPIEAIVGTQRIRTLAKLGGNPDLGPETAESWTFGVELEPKAMPGLRVSLTGFETVFDNRIDRPLVSAPRSSILTDPTLAPFVQRISPTTNAADLALITSLINSPLYQTSQGIFPATAFGAITQSGFVNTAGLTVRGFDATGSYRRGLLGGELTLTGNASWLLDYRRATTPTSPYQEFVGRVGFPAKFRSRAAFDWTRDAFGGGLAWNHVSGSRDNLGARIDGQNTFDLQARWHGADRGWTKGVTATLSVRNLFNAAPPFYDNPLGFGFDATNADVIGRFVALQLTRSW